MIKKLALCLMVPLLCRADQVYKDAYVHNYTETSFSVSSKTLTTLCKDTFSVEDGQAFQDMLILINKVIPNHDFTIIVENSSVAQLDVYRGALSTVSKNQGGCVFCDIVSGTAHGTILAKNQNAVVLKKPYLTPTFLVIPIIHIANKKSLQANINYAVLFVDMLELAYKHVGKQKYRLVSNNGGGSAQMVFHMHWHITPLSVYGR